jgi:hypothetical protein
MTNSNHKTTHKRSPLVKTAKRTIAEKMAVAEQLRNFQQSLAPLRAANKAKRAAGKIEIRIKTK